MLVYWLSYLYFPAALGILLAAKLRKGWLSRSLLATIFAGLSILAYARFVEPRILLVQETTIDLERCIRKPTEIRLALLADTHIGVFKNAMPISRIAKRLEEINPDFTVIAGDFTYYLEPERAEETFNPLGDLSHPVYGVLGNHDLERRSSDNERLKKALSEIGIDLIDNRIIQIQVGDQEWEIIGLADFWLGRPVYTLIDTDLDVPRLVLTHNADIIQHLPDDSLDLMLSGHTHGGQILLTETLTCEIARNACNITRRGLTERPAGKAFITSGLGMVGLPFRFRVPPQIDVLTVRFPGCAS